MLTDSVLTNSEVMAAPHTSEFVGNDRETQSLFAVNVQLLLVRCILPLESPRTCDTERPVQSICEGRQNSLTEGTL